ncbi:hypothetical protein ACFV1F_23710 [Streptomyces sp. NPDC059590]|uniref:hypothetical protein n=1 Tax=Streptomyces sp. NPDC059590 TaxID=3346877 RepID=UPI0036C89BF6
MDRTRPTLRCLTEDLCLPVPPITTPLDEVDHPALNKAQEHFNGTEERPHERIGAIDDQVLFKVKVQRWRGAVWKSEPCPWLVAAGIREDGSADDFYAALATDAKAARSAYNAQHSRPLSTQTYVGGLLPDREVPGCDREGWFPESRLPDRDLLPAEQAWSNVMDPAEARKLLGD